MRAICVLLIAAGALAGDLTPRDGSGWNGFKPGSWVKIKRTPIQEGRMLTVTVVTTRLEKQDDKTLTLKAVTANSLDIRDESTTIVPRRGEADRAEQEKVEKLEAEPLFVAGKRYDCAKTRTTVTGKDGKRVITKWITAEPKAWAKREEIAYDAKGNVTMRATMLLTSFEETRDVGNRKVSCLKYRTRRIAGDFVTTGDIYTSRDVPGNVVWAELESKKNGKLMVTIRAEVLDFETK